MPISSSAFIRSTVAGLLIGVLTLLVIVGATLKLVRDASLYNDRVTASRQLRAAAVDLLATVTTAESGQRGYLLTGERAYLDPFRQADAQFPARLARFQSLIAGEAEWSVMAGQLTTLLSQKMAELEQTVDLTATGAREAALARLRSNDGRELMDQARAVFTPLLAAIEGRVSENIEFQQANNLTLKWVTVIGAVLIILVAGGSAWMSLAYTRQLVRAERQVNVLNTELELRVKARTADLARANEEIQRFAYIVTHDLRAPLVNIMGFTSELEGGLAAMQRFVANDDQDDRDKIAEEARMAAVEDLPEAIGFIRSSTRKMDGLINAILKLSRDGRRTLRPERIELGRLLEAACDNVKHQIMEAEGETSIEGSVPPIYADRLSLEQIFGNLLDNAVKYRSPDRPLRICIRLKQELGGMTAIAFADNGRGIAAQDHERVFDLFRRSGAQDQPGEGIGLAHVHAMARNLGGDITLQSELGKGATFTLRLPRDTRK